MNKSVRVRAGETFDIVLTCAGGTGDAWGFRHAVTTDIKPVTAWGLPEIRSASDDPGAEMTYRFRFQATHPGRQTLRFELRRPSESGPIETRCVEVTIAPAIEPHGLG